MIRLPAAFPLALFPTGQVDRAASLSAALLFGGEQSKLSFQADSFHQALSYFQLTLYRVLDFLLPPRFHEHPPEGDFFPPRPGCIGELLRLAITSLQAFAHPDPRTSPVVLFHEFVDQVRQVLRCRHEMFGNAQRSPELYGDRAALRVFRLVLHPVTPPETFSHLAPSFFRTPE